MSKRTPRKTNNLSAWFKKIPPFVRPRFSEPHFEAHTKAIGSLLLAWNDLHEQLSTLFVEAMGVERWKQSFAIWHATRSDYGMRQLLRAALGNLPESEMGAKIRHPDGSLTGGRPQLVQEITWILDAAKKLEDWRDDSAHTPLSFTYVGDLFSLSDLYTANDLFDLGKLTVVPQAGYANPRALKFQQNKRDILIECRYARDRILVLRDYATAMGTLWVTPPLPWPDRPSLPERKPSRRSKAKAERRKQK